MLNFSPDSLWSSLGRKPRASRVLHLQLEKPQLWGEGCSQRTPFWETPALSLQGRGGSEVRDGCLGTRVVEASLAGGKVLALQEAPSVLDFRCVRCIGDPCFCRIWCLFMAVTSRVNSTRLLPTRSPVSTGTRALESSRPEQRVQFSR